MSFHSRRLFSIDKFVHECRAFTNIGGKGVAATVVSRREGEFDGDNGIRCHRLLVRASRAPGPAWRAAFSNYGQR